jgi:hypothetical protein
MAGIFGSQVGTRGYPVSGSLSAVGAGLPFSPSIGYGEGKYNLTVFGPFAATWKVQRSFDSGTTWYDSTAAFVAQSFTTPGSEVLTEPGVGVQVRVVVTAYTSGTVNYLFNQ